MALELPPALDDDLDAGAAEPSQPARPAKEPRMALQLPPALDDDLDAGAAEPSQPARPAKARRLMAFASDESSVALPSPVTRRRKSTWLEPLVDTRQVELPPSATSATGLQAIELPPPQAASDEGAGSSKDILMPVRKQPPGLWRTSKHTGDALMEVFSPPRLVPVAVRQGLQASISLDKLCGWDANLPESKAHAVRLVREHAPWLLMLSPECTMFSILQRNCNTLRMDPLEVQMRTAEAEDHISFCMHLARVQAESGH